MQPETSATVTSTTKNVITIRRFFTGKRSSQPPSLRIAPTPAGKARRGNAHLALE